MTLTLTEKDQAMLRGDHGPATRMAMSILVRMAEVAGAKELLDITGAHIDSTVYIGDAGLEFAERLAGAGGKGRRADHAERERDRRAPLAGVGGDP